jgi:hypothetical protein
MKENESLADIYMDKKNKYYNRSEINNVSSGS